MQCIRHMTNAYYDNIIKKIFLRYDKRGFEKLEGNRIRKLQDGLYPNIYYYIINRFNDSPKNVTLRENLTRIIYHIEKRPVCKLCGKEVSFNGKKKLNFFDNYCSCRCAGIDTYNYNSLLKQQEYNLKHYGVKHNFQTKKFKEKRKQSLIEHFGSLNDFQKYTENKGKETLIEHYGSLENAYKVSSKHYKKTCLEKYGKDSWFGSNDAKKYYLEKYGVEHPMKLDEIQIKTQQTNINKYGCNSWFGSNDANKYYLEKYGVEHPMESEYVKEKLQQTNINKYGVKYGLQNEKIKLKSIQTCLNKYGVKCVGQSQTVKAKIIETKRKNHTFNTSKPEENGYKLLYNKFGFCNVKRQYKSKLYPFQCDFYIVSLNMYIEFNFHWTHGGHKFDQNDKNDVAKLNIWKEKSVTSKFYKSALTVWTERDIKKFKYATENNLNYLVFYNWNEFLEWYDKN